MKRWMLVIALLVQLSEVGTSQLLIRTKAIDRAHCDTAWTLTLMQGAMWLGSQDDPDQYLRVVSRREDGIVIQGGRPLAGRVPISGAKNAALALMPQAAADCLFAEPERQRLTNQRSVETWRGPVAACRGPLSALSTA